MFLVYALIRLIQISAEIFFQPSVFFSDCRLQIVADNSVKQTDGARSARLTRRLTARFEVTRDQRSKALSDRLGLGFEIGLGFG